MNKMNYVYDLFLVFGDLMYINVLLFGNKILTFFIRECFGKIFLYDSVRRVKMFRRSRCVDLKKYHQKIAGWSVCLCNFNVAISVAGNMGICSYNHVYVRGGVKKPSLSDSYSLEYSRECIWPISLSSGDGGGEINILM